MRIYMNLIKGLIKNMVTLREERQNPKGGSNGK